MPANIVVDADYLIEVRRREVLIGIPGASKSPKEVADGFVEEAQDPILEGAPKLSDVKDIEQGCLERRSKAVLNSIDFPQSLRVGHRLGGEGGDQWLANYEAPIESKTT
jgi:hypothetical protein